MQALHKRAGNPLPTRNGQQEIEPTRIGHLGHPHDVRPARKPALRNRSKAVAALMQIAEKPDLEVIGMAHGIDVVS
jgi:hypothetical protein